MSSVQYIEWFGNLFDMCVKIVEPLIICCFFGVLVNVLDWVDELFGYKCDSAFVSHGKQIEHCKQQEELASYADTANNHKQTLIEETCCVEIMTLWVE